MRQELQDPKHKPACALNHGGEWCNCKSVHQAVAEAIQKARDRRIAASQIGIKKRCAH